MVNEERTTRLGDPASRLRTPQTGEVASLRAPHSTFHVPREGKYWLLIAGVLLGIGMLKAINLLTLVACLMLALWVLNAVVAGRRLRWLQGHRSLAGPVFAQTPFLVEVTLTNPRRGSQTGLRLEDRSAKHAVAWFLPRLDGREVVRLRRENLVLSQRGRYAWEPLHAASSFPFGLAERRAEVAPAEEVIVLPRLGRLHRGRLRRLLARAGLPSARASLQHPRRHPTAQTEFHGLRAFRSGDSPRSIHWRTSARCGELMVREFEDVPTDNLILVVDPWLPGNEEHSHSSAGRSSSVMDPGVLLEDAVSLAATICWEWCRQTGDRFVLAVAGVEPVVVDGTTGRDHARRMLECLAVEAGNPGKDRAAVLEKLAARPLPWAPVLFVTTRDDGLGDVLGKAVSRPIARLDVSALAEIDFYEKPSHAGRC